MIASHYAEPLARQITSDADADGRAERCREAVAELGKGDDIRMLDSSRGWAWGYAGPTAASATSAREAVGRLSVTFRRGRGGLRTICATLA